MTHDDAEARTAALNPAQSFIVQAPAGSGKTTLLTQRLLRLLTTVEYPEQVVAITFTRKAAEEMRARIIAALELGAGAETVVGLQVQTRDLARATLAHDQRQGWNLRAQPSRLRIMTIDALCQHLVRQAPLSARMPGQPMVEDDAERLYQEAARETLSQLADGGRWGAAVARLLSHLDNDWGRLEALIADMLARRDQWLRELGRGADRVALQRAYADLVAGVLARTARALPQACHAELIALGDHGGRNLAMTVPHENIAALAGMTTLPATTHASLAQWQGLAELLLTASGEWRKQVNKNQGFPPGAGVNAGMKTRLQDCINAMAQSAQTLRVLQSVQSLPARLFEADEWQLVEALLVVLQLAAAQLVVLGQRSGRVDFTAFAIAAQDALGEAEQPSDLALSLDYRLQHLLVDEFQDTSVTQHELLLRLTAGWTGGDGRSLFLVGDPMQSIYRFRQAEVALFTDLLESKRLGSVALNALQLQVNFRAQAGLVRWINAAMPPALEQVEAVPFVHQQAARPDDGPAYTVHAWEEQDVAGEAARVLAIVNGIRAELPAASIAILVRSRSHLGRITAHLRASGVAVAAREIQALVELAAINDLLALTRALMHAGDRIAWLAVLRAPWCGATLATLHTLAAHAGTVLDAVTDGALLHTVEAEDASRVARVGAILAHALADGGRVSLSRLVENTWVALGGPAALTEQQHVDDVRAYFQLLSELEQDGDALTVARLQRHLSQAYSSAPAGDPAAVQVMTMHRAKGLEFDHVIVPGLGRRPRADPKRLLLWREQVATPAARSGLLLAPLPVRGNSPLYDYLRARDRADTDAEAVRLLYVALTRARRQVHLLGHARRGGDADLMPEQGSFLAMLWPLLEDDFVRALSQGTHATPLTNPVKLPQLRRLALASLPPAPPAVVANDPATATPPEFDWAGTTARHIGTVAHRLLQALAQDAATTWSPSAASFARGQLRALGVAAAELDTAVLQLADALHRTLNSARGRWLFSPAHREAQAELGLGLTEFGRAARVVIDRTFVDDEGRRWIVDFKTGRHAGGAVDVYLASEVIRYRPQLDRYARIFATLDDRPIMLGLYFPLLDAWREWPFTPDPQQP